jgi:predicted PurR-regulated permease PerM
MQLAIITPTVNNSIEKIRQLIDTIRKPGAGTLNQLEDLKKAIELQATVNKEMNDKLKLIETVLQTVQKSLKILAVTGVGVGLIALLALIVAVVKWEGRSQSTGSLAIIGPADRMKRSGIQKLGKGISVAL